MNPDHEGRRIAQYLQHYCEPEARELHCSKLQIAHDIEHCLMIPLYDENPDCLAQHFDFLRQQRHSVLILVINQPDTVTASTANNITCWEQICQLQPRWTLRNLSLWAIDPDNSVLVVDRYSKGLRIPTDQGVGLARKIAADMALVLAQRKGCGLNWICCTDADALLPADYFYALQRGLAAAAGQPAAAVFAFEHIPSGDLAIDTATQYYERRILGYRDGLAYAKSPYAFCALGSAMACSLSHYVAARGFPRRAAGEDFYLLNKLRKLGPVVPLDTVRIALASRQSTRTPFGTGASVQQLLAHGESRDGPAIFYHPGLFELLRLAIAWLRQDGIALSSDWQAHLAGFIADNPGPIHAFLTTSNGGRGTAQLLIEALEAVGFGDGLAHCLRQSRNNTQFHQHMLHWFDAFKTLRIVHELRDREAALGWVNEADSVRLAQALWIPVAKFTGETGTALD